MADKRDSKKSADDPGSAATENVIAQFGGLRPTASKLGVAVSTVQGWKERGHIPAARIDALRVAAAQAGIALSEPDLRAAADAAPSASAQRAAEASGSGRTAKTRSGGSGTKPSGGPATPSPREEPKAVPSPPPEEPEATIEIVEDAVTGETIETVVIEHRRGLTGVTAMLALIVGGAAFALPYLPPEIRSMLLLPNAETGAAPSGELEIFRSRIDDLEAENARLSEEIAVLRGLETPQIADIAEAATVAATEAIRDDFSGRFASLTEAVRAASGRAESGLAQVRSHLNRLENAPPDTTMADEARQGRRELALRLDSAAQRLDSFQDQIQVVNDQLAALNAIGDRLDAQSVKLNALDERIDSTEDDMRQVEGRAADLERVARINRATSPREAAILLAVGQLRSALAADRPYDSEIGTLSRMLGSGIEEIPRLAAAMDAAAKAASVGAPSLATLKREFPIAARRTAAASASRGDGWFNRTLARLSSLVSVRRIEDDGSDTTESRLARAEAALATSGLNDAIAAVAAIEGSNRAGMRDWLEQARARGAADALAASLSADAIERLAGITRPTEAAE